jgi:hypothetical protein
VGELTGPDINEESVMHVALATPEAAR